MSDIVYAYWFGQADADGVVRLGHGDGRAVRAGETLTVDGDPMLCEWGLHASRQVLDALRDGDGPMFACVRLSGQIVEGDDKLAGTARETVWLGDVSATLHRFACDVAERALRAERDAGREPDPRLWAAITVKRRWLAGEATAAALAMARPAAAWIVEDGQAVVAGYAAQAAARAAMWAADAAADAAAWAAAAALAVKVAAWTDAWDAAWPQERAWQEAHVRELLREAGVPIWEEAAR